MDGEACRRAAIESLSENLVDGFVSPIFWYVLLGAPGIVLFKVASTMDSMVGYKTPRYLKFGWCGARLDDLLNLLPARLTWLLIALVAALVPGGSGRKALAVGWRQHAIVPGPNAGWSEAAAAGAIRRKLIGPIWAKGRLVTEVWLGDPDDPPAGSAADYRRAAAVVTGTAALFAALSITLLVAWY
jgi:adenosylcobinamide-phosphate synthase